MIRHPSPRKNRGLAIVCLCLLATAGLAQALDFTDVQNLLKNQVPEQVIINMVQSDATLAITQEQANQLRGMGASEALVRAIRRTSAGTAAAPAPVNQYPASGTAASSVDPAYEMTYEQPLPAGTTTLAAPPVASSSGTVAQGPVYYDPNIYYPDGTVVSSSPGTVYYESSPGYVVQSPSYVVEAPTTYVYDYSSPYYYNRGPSWGIGFGWSSGWGSPYYRGGPRHYGPPPRYHGGGGRSHGPGRPRR